MVVVVMMIFQMRGSLLKHDSARGGTLVTKPPIKRGGAGGK